MTARLKFAAASAFLRAGLTLGTQADEGAVRALIRRLHPVETGFPLIRIGNGGDGGYLLPDDLDGIAACFSPGVAQTALFEEEMVARGVPCMLADASVEAPPISGPLIRFEKKFLGVVNDERFTTLDAWVERNAPTEGDLLLQMDIEGSEWAVLLNASDKTLQRFRVIVLELHDLDRLIDKVGFMLLGRALDRLLTEFHVVHIHPNNYDGVVRKKDLVIPRVIEATFLRKDRAAVTGYASEFPHPLDRTNQPRRPDIALPANWYRSAGS